MKLIADSGSTKTHWCLIRDHGEYECYYTPGINPFFQTEFEIEDHIRKKLLPQIGAASVEEIYFYGAGCATEKQKETLAGVFTGVFDPDKVEVESDLLGAARALCGDMPGIACILGTGSNSCYYDGREIVKQVSPLGYIIGDEGSGAILGKRLVADCLKNQLPQPIRERFFERFGLTQAQIIENVYTKPFPNRFLASLSVFLKENLEQPELRRIVYVSFSEFFKRNVCQYDYQHNKVNIVGSVGYHYQEVLRQVMNDMSLHAGIIIQAPMDNLRIYHTDKSHQLERA